jgi:AraC-like DNA-binding protein
MKPIFDLEPAYRVTNANSGLSAAGPVRAASWVDGTGESRHIYPGDAEYPGYKYGAPVYCPDRQDRRPHDHSHFEINLIRQGRVWHQTVFRTEELEPRTVVVMPPGRVHAMYGLGGVRQTNIYYVTEWLAEDLMAHWREAGLVPVFLAASLFRSTKLAPIPIFQISEADLALIDHELEQITIERLVEPPSLTMLRSCLLKILIILSRACVQQLPDQLSLGFREEVEIALDHIENTIQRAEPFHVSDIAGRLGISQDYFSTLFKESTGWSPMAYFQRRRVQVAGSQLLDLSRSITEVAHALGYCDAAHLTHLFKQNQGMTPTEYRAYYTAHRHAPPVSPSLADEYPDESDITSPSLQEFASGGLRAS